MRPHVFDDANMMRKIKPSSYDFVMCNHMLEHANDFLGAIAVWIRLVTPGGLVLFSLPDPCDYGWLRTPVGGRSGLWSLAELTALVIG